MVDRLSLGSTTIITRTVELSNINPTAKTHQQLVREVAAITGVPQRYVNLIIRVYLERVAFGVIEYERVLMPGLMSLSKRLNQGGTVWNNPNDKEKRIRIKKKPFYQLTLRTYGLLRKELKQLAEEEEEERND